MKALSDIREYWNQRSTLGATAGTPDLIAQQLEQRAILEACHGLPDPAFGLEIGCGTGATARLLVKAFPRLDLLAVDGSEGMIAVAKQRSAIPTRLRFKVCEASSLPNGRFDLILTQRMLINLPTWELQKQTIEAIAARLAPGGRFVMCENSQDGLDSINQTRLTLGLPEIQRPWHNRYVNGAELATVTSMTVIRESCFSAEYYFLSRIVNAYAAKMAGEEPVYDSPINQLAALCGEWVDGRFAQGRVWVWRKPAQ